MHKAVGMIEVFGLATAFAAADAGCKAGNVTLEPFDKNKPGNADELPVPLIVMIKFRGDIADVEAALEAAKNRANELSGVVTEYAIARPDEGTEKMLKLNAFDKGSGTNKKQTKEV
ncbi:microcompartment protein CcmL/EutN [Lachnospiraceae bacterium PF1-21]|uniref:BMC domain-containing protein n=1 Tax=Ohessyouella blattaphilus TaxID=2949333 RepID=A0ABT1EI18_9FIRM|nr:BMC domain-containing protein [Ohessyouella blattaphilus]MCP1108947.1 BMC domain-containing protein [Ohessyouella blattaphilus]MCR8562341.1 BMC domain-containing protein [Ohessyouella blattaphilus]MDL2249895.1 BMC domain-containing protein [Lachnospiraceae bacterium OttesenSCG-928-J05]